MKSSRSLHATIVLIFLLNLSARAVVPNGAQADIVIGQQPANASNLKEPGVAVDPATQKVFVADESRHRILRFSSTEAVNNGAAAEAVFGQADFAGQEPGTGPDRLRNPSGVWVDTSGRLWVSDSGNNRVLRFDNAATRASGPAADGVLGQVNFTNSGAGTSASALRSPAGLAADLLGNLYVADSENNRVLRFNNAATLINGAAANAVLGQPGFANNAIGSGATGFFNPTAVALSPNPVFVTLPYLWVADASHNRVLLFANAPQFVNQAAAVRVLGQPDFTHYDPAVSASGLPEPRALAADSSGRLYVGTVLNRVLRFENATAKANNAPADGVLGQNNFTSSTAGSGPGDLAAPIALALGQGGRLWIGDRSNHRVLRHESAHTKANGADADSALGAASTTTDLTRLLDPRGLAIDPVSGKLFVSDAQRNRVLRFASVAALTSGAGAEAVFGQADFSGAMSGLAANRMNQPHALAMNGLGHLWVSDEGNHRVLRFNNAAQRPSGIAADGVLGQANFTSGADLPQSATSLRLARGMAVGPAGELWVADSKRVVRFDNAHTKSNGAAADGVLGQSNLTGEIGPVTDAFHFYPSGISVETNGRLWVFDFIHFRILRFDNAAAKNNGASADGVLGQPDFLAANDGGLGPQGLHYGTVVAETGGRLWALDSLSNRALRWEHAGGLAAGASADGVLGQVDFGFGASGSGLGQFNYPTAIARDTAGRLWIADSSNERVVRYSPQTARLAIAPKNANTVTLTVDRHAPGVRYRFETSLDLQVWAPGLPFTPVTGDPILLDVSMAPEGHEFFRVVED